MRPPVPPRLDPFLAVLAAALVVVTGACSSSVPDEPGIAADLTSAPDAEPEPSGEDASVAAVAAPPDVTPERAPVPVVDFEVLVGRLPDLPAWSRSGERGERLSIPVSYARAEAEYRRGDSRIDLEIVDTGQSALLLAPLSVFLASGFSERWSGGLRRAVRIGEAPAFEAWNEETRQGEVTRVVRDRYVVRTFGYDLDGLEPLRTVAAAVSADGLP